jgi:pimeloyl-ACP methyl ester carboxylesterase
MSNVLNGLFSIHYQEFGAPHKPVLVLIFGISMTMDDWLDFSYIEYLQQHFRLIVIEPRGHGQSATPHLAKDYVLSAMAADISTVLNQLQIQKALVWGYSLGAKIALAWAGSAPERVYGLILGGFELHSIVDLSDDLVSSTLERGGNAWLALWQQMFTVPNGLGERLKQANTLALMALRQAEAAWPNLAEHAAKLSTPCIIYAGEYCFYRHACAEMKILFPNAIYLERAGKNHFDLMPDAKWICDEVIARFALE